MPWARVDDSLHSHRKLRRAGLEAAGTYLMALSYCAAYLTDGHVDEDFFEELIPAKQRRERVLAKLIEHHLLEPNGTGFLVHDYLDYNPSRETIERRRQEALKRKHKERGRG